MTSIQTIFQYFYQSVLITAVAVGFTVMPFAPALSPVQTAEANHGSGTVYVDVNRTSSDSSENGTQTKPFDKIQEGVDHANPNETVKVLSGDYNETVTVDVSGLTLEGPNAGTSGNSNQRNSEAIISDGINVNAGSVTLDGFQIQNPGEQGAADPDDYSGAVGVNIQTNKKDVTVKNNVITKIGTNDDDANPIGVYSPDGTTGLTVSDNLITDLEGTDEDKGAVQAVQVDESGTAITDVSITDNTITDLLDTRSTVAVRFNGDVSGSISDNQISDLNTEGTIPGSGGDPGGFTQVIALQQGGASDTGPSNVMIEDNEISNIEMTTEDNFAPPFHIIVGSGADGSTILVKNNDFNADSPDSDVILSDGTGELNINKIFNNNFTNKAVVIRENPIKVPTIFSSIQDAIDNASTTNGDIIEVDSGTYDEKVTVNKELTLKGANAGNPGTGSRGSESTIKQGVDIRSGDVVLDGFEVTNDDVNGVKVSLAVDDVQIKNNVVSDVSGGTAGSKGVGNGINLQFTESFEETSKDIVIKKNKITDISTPSVNGNSADAIGVQLLPRGNDVKNLKITDNQISNIEPGTANGRSEARGISIATQFDDKPGGGGDGYGDFGQPLNLQIKVNTIAGLTADFARAITLFEDKAGPDGSESDGPAIGPENFKIKKNTIENINSNDGGLPNLAMFVGEYDKLGDSHRVEYNNLLSNVENFGASTQEQLKATKNWWGAANGPKKIDGNQSLIGNNGSGTAAIVNKGDIDVEPWLCDRFEKGESIPKTTTDGNCGPYQDDVFSGNDKVRICKALGNGSYNNKDQNVNSITNSNSQNSGINQDSIIPPFEYENGDGTTLYEGQNWTSENQTLWNNNCGVSNEEPQEDTGAVSITKYSCDPGTQINADGVTDGNAKPDKCNPQSGVKFSATFEDKEENGGFNGTPGTTTVSASTSQSGMVTIDELSTDGRYLFQELKDNGEPQSKDNILHFACEDDTGGKKDNKEIAFIEAGQTDECVIYNKRSDDDDDGGDLELLSCEPDALHHFKTGSADAGSAELFSMDTSGSQTLESTYDSKFYPVLAADENGDFYGIRKDDNKLVVLQDNGNVEEKETISSTLEKPVGMTFTYDGTLYAVNESTDGSSDQLFEIDRSDGSVTAKTSGSSDLSVAGGDIFVDQYGDIIYVKNSGRVYLIEPDNGFTVTDFEENIRAPGQGIASFTSAANVNGTYYALNKDTDELVEFTVDKDNMNMDQVERESSSSVSGGVAFGDATSCPVEPESRNQATLVADKVVCDSEEDLPNWGVEGANIDAQTAQNFVSDNDSCSLEPNWQFQWTNGENGSQNGDDSFVGEKDSWSTFSGTTTINLDVLDGNTISVREVLKENYIPFTFASNGDNSDNESAEFYCSADGANYDNLEYISGLEDGQTAHCVGFNTQSEPEKGTISGMKFEDDPQFGEKNDGEEGLEGWEIVAFGEENLVDTVTVEADDASGATTTALQTGDQYLIEVEGRYAFADNNDEFDGDEQRIADAEYFSNDGGNTWSKTTTDKNGNGLDLLINGSAVDWGARSSSHLYRIIDEASSGSANFRIWDQPYDDNTGELTVRIYNVSNYSDTTDENGNYSIEVPLGEYTVTEVMQSGFEQTYPEGGEHTADLNDDGQEIDNLDFGNDNLEEEDEQSDEENPNPEEGGESGGGGGGALSPGGGSDDGGDDGDDGSVLGRATSTEDTNDGGSDFGSLLGDLAEALRGLQDSLGGDGAVAGARYPDWPNTGDGSLVGPSK